MDVADGFEVGKQLVEEGEQLRQHRISASASPSLGRACCALTARGARTRLTARATASPMSRMGTSWGMAGGSLTEGDCPSTSAPLADLSGPAKSTCPASLLRLGLTRR